MPRQSHQHKPSLRKHISTAFYAAFIASVSGGFTTVYSNTASAEEHQVFDFKLPAGKLEDALNALAKQSAITLTFDANQVKGKTVPAIKQLLTREQALQLLLKDTALEAKPTNGAIIIVPRPIAAHTDTLPEVSVSASRSRTTNALPQPFAGGQVAKASRMGILGNVDIFETPFSTQSYTEEFVLDQQARRLADIIAADPSTRSAMAEYGDSETYHIRGFPLFTNQVGINGLYGMTDLRRIAPDFYERVDVLKGPASMLNGSSPFGVTGGNINLVSKRAGDTPLNRFTASYISDSQFGGHLDLGRRFGEDNAWGVRLNVLARDGDTPISRQSDRMHIGSLAVDYRGEKLTASFDLASQDRLTRGYSANITYDTGFALPRAPQNDKNFVNDWEFFKGDSHYWMTKFEYEFTPALTAYINYGQAKGNEEYFYAGSQGRRIINSAGDFTARAGGYRGWYEVDTYEVGLRGFKQLGSVSNNYALVYNDFNRIAGGAVAHATAPYTGNIYQNPNLPKPTVNFGVIPQNGDLQLNSIGLINTFGFVQDNVLLTLGARQQTLYSGIFNNGVKKDAYDESKVTPTSALLIKLGNYSLYGNYSEGLSQGAIAPSTAVNHDEQLPPFVAKQHEIGVKYNAGTFGVTAAVFQITQPNTYTTSNRLVDDGEQRNRGLELSTFGQPLSGLRLLGGVTFIDAEQTKTQDGINNGKDAIGVPKVNVVINGEYDIFAVPGLSLTGRISGFSEAQANAGNTQSIPGWTTFDAGARYVTHISGNKVTLRANVMNLADKNYWNSVSRSFITMGAPRTALLSATIDF
ncbi:TonB-dependent receptor [Methylophilus sp. QUAN]|uniref:TonB-dependent receptor n=1 Tax=Methylophilus sp. QUAN TaxID=2781020 RepID=UPI00188E5292|nr:TonB-dependent receptor [Methylophilus sp. QUAN]MBF4990824.1 TonB-dependent receptor [Methylophilus sp. QUAN]